MVEEEEGVGEGHFRRGEGPPYFETVTFELALGADDLRDRTPLGFLLRKGLETGKLEGIGGYGWPFEFPFCLNGTGIRWRSGGPG